jgi:hypothetical protein
MEHVSQKRPKTGRVGDVARCYLAEASQQEQWPSLTPPDGANADIITSGKPLIFETVFERLVFKFWADIASTWRPWVCGW